LLVGLAASIAAGTTLAVTSGSSVAQAARGEHFRTLPVTAVLPHSDAACARRVTRNHWEPRPENSVANHRVPRSAVPWNNTAGWRYWRAFIGKRDRVTGRFTGTTDEIIQWAACKWGIDEDVVRAVAVQESYWKQALRADVEAGRAHSFGLMQIRHDDASGCPRQGRLSGHGAVHRA